MGAMSFQSEHPEKMDSSWTASVFLVFATEYAFFSVLANFVAHLQWL